MCKRLALPVTNHSPHFHPSAAKQHKITCFYSVDIAIETKRSLTRVIRAKLSARHGLFFPHSGWVNWILLHHHIRSNLDHLGRIEIFQEKSVWLFFLIAVAHILGGNVWYWADLSFGLLISHLASAFNKEGLSRIKFVVKMLSWYPELVGLFRPTKKLISGPYLTIVVPKQLSDKILSIEPKRRHK